MRHFKKDATHSDPYNNYILAKLAETMYSERLDYMYRYFQNDRKPVDSIPSTGWLKEHPILNDTIFEQAFGNRFKHMFLPEDSVIFKFIHKTEYIKNIFGKTTKIGFDPEVMVISTKTYTIIVWRGTDMMENNKLGEWVGTDFHAWKTGKSTYFNEGRIHKGFNKSLELIHPDLEAYLDTIQAKDKPVFVTGHSLGGAMAILTAFRLDQLGYNLPKVFVYGTPNSIVNKKFIENTPTTIVDKIERFEFYLDPFPMLWIPGYTSFGHRTWVLPDWKMMVDIPPRTFSTRKYKCKDCPKAMKQTIEFAFEKNFFRLPTKVHNHNPQWYTKALVHYISKDELENCPDIDDSFPFIYYGWEESR